ncbi:MAG TPA: histidine phosphatase family protein [Actinocrinis sp.]|nr:histidine phosphatase family protein [Actinocrinis sp.]
MTEYSTRRIILVRHAKAVEPDVRDHERALAGRGRRNAPDAGRWLAASGVVPDLALCSTAARTRETWKLLSAELADAPRTVYDERIYGASPGALFAVVSETPDDVADLVVVGHNPGMHALAYMLSRESAQAEELITRMNETGFPTCAIAILAIEGGWPDVVPGAGRLVEYWTPRGQ